MQRGFVTRVVIYRTSFFKLSLFKPDERCRTYLSSRYTLRHAFDSSKEEQNEENLRYDYLIITQ